MKKENIKEIFILPIMLIISEVINFIIMFGTREIITKFVSEENFTYEFFKRLDNISFFVIIIVSLLIYLCVGIKIFDKIGDEKTQKYSMIITAILIVVSYPVSELLTIVTGQYYYFIHMMICSPIASLIAALAGDIPYLYELLLILFSPVSILLIWLFSKIGDKKKKQSDSDV